MISQDILIMPFIFVGLALFCLFGGFITKQTTHPLFFWIGTFTNIATIFYVVHYIIRS